MWTPFCQWIHQYGWYHAPEKSENEIYMQIDNDIIVKSLVSGHPRELKKVSVGRAVRLRELVMVIGLSGARLPLNCTTRSLIL